MNIVSGSIRLPSGLHMRPKRDFTYQGDNVKSGHAQDIDVATIEQLQSFLSLYIYYCIIEEEGCQRRKWVGRHGDAFADIFCGALGYTYQHCMRCVDKL